MTQISRFKVNADVLEKLNDLLFELLSNKSKDAFQIVLRDLISPTEKVMIAKRIGVIYLLEKNIDQRTITSIMKVSLATVSRYALLIRSSRTIPNALEKLITKERTRLLVSQLFELLFPPGTMHTNWKSSWKLRAEIERKKRRGF